MKQVLISVAIYILAISLARAEKLDLSAHDSIIQKLESAASISTDDSMVQTIQLNHRLADLYAERARLLSMEDEGKGAQTFKTQIDTDRKKAIATLTKILNRLSQNKKGPALLQMAHLFEMLSQNEEALKIYNSIEKNSKSYDDQTNALSQIKLGDFAFVANELTKSQKHFEKSLTFKTNPRKSYSQYRLAWVHYNQGQTLLGEKMLLSLLQSKEQKDAAFVDEVSHDLATFLARNNLSQTDLKTYLKVTPEPLRKRNLIYLAQELDRTAKKQNALKVWALVGTQNISFEDQIERQINITRIEYDLGRLEAVNVEIGKSIVLLKKSACSDNPNCTVAQQNLRKVITDWARAEERKVSAELITAFNKYTENFEDYEMNFWAAGLASKRQQHQDAFAFYLRASTLLKDINPRNAQQQKLFELSLVGGIEMAEYAKDPQMKLQAYRRYLEFNPKGAQRNEVRYQIAQWYYNQNNYAQARDDFKTLSLDTSVSKELREKSADLCLDTNVLLKDEKRIETDSFEFAQEIPSKKSEYLTIYRKSILNQTALLLNSKSDESALSDEQKKLNKIDSQSFAGREKQQLLKNKMEIAFRLKDLNSLSAFSQQLLKEKDLKKEDEQKAFHYLAWMAEIRMNFKEALKYMKLIQPLPKELASYYLKVAMLKELSSQNPVAEYEKFLGFSRDSQKNAFAAHQIVLHSAKPLKPFNKYEKVLKAKPELYASAALFIYEETKDPNFAKRILSVKEFNHSAESDLVRHQKTIIDFKAMATELSRAKMRMGSDAAMRKSIVQRNELLRAVENTANRSIAKKDTVEQLLFLPLLAFENKRLASEILALPKPKGLNKTEKLKYEEQLKALVAPYEKQSVAISTKVKEIWNQSATANLLSALDVWSTQIQRPGHSLALQELSLLKASVQNLGLTSPVFENLSERRQKLSSELQTEASTLQSKINKSPFDFSYLEKMKTLQNSLGSGTMVAYLDSRIGELSTELNSRGR